MNVPLYKPMVHNAKQWRFQIVNIQLIIQLIFLILFGRRPENRSIGAGMSDSRLELSGLGKDYSFVC